MRVRRAIRVRPASQVTRVTPVPLGRRVDKARLVSLACLVTQVFLVNLATLDLLGLQALRVPVGLRGLKAFPEYHLPRT